MTHPKTQGPGCNSTPRTAGTTKGRAKMRISDEELARTLRYVRDPGLIQWDRARPYVHDTWLKVAAKARELLTPEPELRAPFPGSLGPLQVGDMVGMRGVVTELDEPHPAVAVKIDGYRGTGIDGGALWLDPMRVTLIERPTPPEPDWQPGDVAQDEKGGLYRYRGAGTVDLWVDLRTERMPGGSRFLCRAEIPGPLTPCDVVPREAKP